MKRNLRVALGVLTLAVGLVGAYAGWTRVRSPKSAAHEDSYIVWVALLKGFSGDVVYVGSDDTHAYFRLGSVFWSYYKVPACAAHLPETFSVDRGSFYRVRLHVQPGNVIQVINECDQREGYALGELERQ